MGPNGKVYGIPREYKKVLELDPETKQIQLFGDIPESVTFYAGALAPNGKIYAFPEKA